MAVINPNDIWSSWNSNNVSSLPQPYQVDPWGFNPSQMPPNDPYDPWANPQHQTFNPFAPYPNYGGYDLNDPNTWWNPQYQPDDPSAGGGSDGGIGGGVGAGGTGAQTQSPPTSGPPASPLGPYPRPPQGVGGTGAGYQGSSWYSPSTYGSGVMSFSRPSAPWYDISNDYNDQFERMSEQDRLAAYAFGHGMDQDLMDAGNRSDAARWGILGDLMTQPHGYGDIFAGSGGYAPEEANDILQGDSVAGAVASDEDLQGLNYTNEDYESLYGNPWETQGIARDRLSHMWEVQGEGNKRQREAFGENGYLESRVRPTVDPTKLRQGEDYLGNMLGGVRSLAGAYEDIYDPSTLSTSQEFLDNYMWSPEDTENLGWRAARDVGFQTANKNASLERALAAEGNSGPLAFAAARNANDLTGTIAANEAMQDARLRGKELELNSFMDRENVRQDANRYLADSRAAAARDTSGKALAAMEGAEAQRIAAEQGYSDRAYNMESDIGSRRLQNEKDILAQEAELGRYDTDTILNETRYGEGTQTQRRTDAINNRINNVGNLLNTKYSQRMGAGDVLSNRYQGIYDARRADQQEGRGFLRDTTQSMANEAQNARGQRIQSANNTLTQGQNASRSAVEAWYKRKVLPSALERAANVAIGVAGAFGPNGGG